ncbi:Alcohol dehydrogenase GroES-like domain-containing protein [Scedosporium apiospermum]|uniref:Alcohol dehydrogenase GroES-like domain-containing protein n=1 Tax=Pseudallescheria apiosperma TaxID=563466 RepID=A0A084GCL3_PSEDA|nr:Alcohol dehydrogenase GroES-like domain-containing protein [Scedosporium apiospermum]KEZ45075.1 Alcohol dehydrogenase GroES-like domain-containing protein [Scedosporium apiospermum]
MASEINLQSMKVAHLREYNKPYEIQRKPIPDVGDHELLIRVHAAGFCHSDLQVIQGQFPTTLPMIPSHEPSGVVVRVGSKCAGSWKPGDRVGVLNFKNACGHCTGCGLSRRKSGGLDPRFCQHREMAGFRHDGAFAEYMTADPSTTVLLPESIPFEQAAPLMCAGATVWGAIEKATSSLEPGDAVGIVGIGGLGHLGVQFAKALGYRVVAIDSREAGRQLATEVSNPELVPDLVVDSMADDATAKIQQFTDCEGLAAVVVCTDSLAANSWAPTLLRIQGVLVVLGLPPQGWHFDSEIMAFRELVIRGSYVADTESTKRMMEVVDKHNIRSHVTIVAFDEIPRIVEAYRDPSFKGRLVVQISQ